MLISLCLALNLIGPLKRELPQFLKSRRIQSFIIGTTSSFIFELNPAEKGRSNRIRLNYHSNKFQSNSIFKMVASRLIPGIPNYANLIILLLLGSIPVPERYLCRLFPQIFLEHSNAFTASVPKNSFRKSITTRLVVEGFQQV